MSPFEESVTKKLRAFRKRPRTENSPLSNVNEVPPFREITNENFYNNSDLVSNPGTFSSYTVVPTNEFCENVYELENSFPSWNTSTNVTFDPDYNYYMPENNNLNFGYDDGAIYVSNGYVSGSASDISSIENNPPEKLSLGRGQAVCKELQIAIHNIAIQLRYEGMEDYKIVGRISTLLNLSTSSVSNVLCKVPTTPKKRGRKRII